MEELGAQVANPYLVNQPLPPHFCQVMPPMPTKRHLPWLNPNHHQQFQNPNSNWNPNVWDWDTVRFVANPAPEAEAEADPLCLAPPTAAVPLAHKNPLSTNNNSISNSNTHVDKDPENLTLKLGGTFDQPLSRPNKRVRSGSPTTAPPANYPMCQVDDCPRDLSNAKDYHRRHKVCEVHSKTTKALVANQMQRFCQQCSRFHPLAEFDEGKRSCRRRLAGHNRRRRKTQPENVSSHHLLPGNQDTAVAGNFDIVNLLTILANLQGNNAERTTSGAPLPDRDRLIQILSKINSIPVTTNSAARLPQPGGFDLNVSQQVPSDQPNKLNGSTSVSSTMDLRPVPSTAAATSSPGGLAVLAQRSSQNGDLDRTKFNCVSSGTGVNLTKEVISAIPAAGVVNTTKFQSPVEAPNCRSQQGRPNLPFQLFSSSPEDDSQPKLRSSRKYFSSDSSNPMEERSPSSSPPVVQKLFPLQAAEIMKHESLSVSGDDNGMVETSTAQGGWSSQLGLFNRPNGRAEHRLFPNQTSQAGYTSSSGSDQSPSSSNSDLQDRTGRIIFKLFDKDPSNLPATLRTQILKWLSHSPSEMESYIRPGCIVLSIYIAMPATTWAQLQEDFHRRVKLLVEDSDSNFWRNGRFLVRTDKQLASHKDGKIRLCKSWRTWSTPELISVSPLAIVTGQETSLVLKGRNLTVPGTKIHCTYMGQYISKKVTGSAGATSDNTSLESFSFSCKSPGVLGRCFVEVENGFRGNNLPVIVADATICRELRCLESELEDDARVGEIVMEDKVQGFGGPRSREEVVHFLNELGWLFQKNTSLSLVGPYFAVTRFRFLLTFSVERDWCALAKKLLDIFVESNSGAEGLSKESLETLNEIHLLNRAVKRRSISMVNLLIQYSLTSKTDLSRMYLFFPSQKGPGGITPLHLAASALDSEQIVDALTNDPQEIGLSSWNSLLDANGHSPYSYASLRENHGYNKLVARKLADRKNGQVSIPVGDDISLDHSWIQAEQANRSTSQSLQGQRSCSRCAVIAARQFKRMPGARGLLHRPYVHSLLTIAAVCVCVCLFLRGSPDIGRVAPFKWENLHFGTS